MDIVLFTLVSWKTKISKNKLKKETKNFYTEKLKTSQGREKL